MLLALLVCVMSMVVGSTQTTYPITSRLIGTGATGTTDGDALTAATMNGPSFISADMLGNLYITTTSRHVVRFYSASLGTLTTIVGQSGSAGYGDGTGTAARLNSPMGVAVERRSNNQGRVFICDRDNRRIRAYNPVTRAVTTFAGSGSSATQDGTGTGASFTTLQNIAAGITYLYVAEGAGTVGYIRRIHMTTQAVSTIYTNPTYPVVSVAFNPMRPTELYFAVVGTIYALNLTTNAARTIKTFAYECAGMALLPDGTLAYTCPTSNKNAVYFISPSGVESTLGQEDTPGYVEGPSNPTPVRFNKPTGIAVASAASEYAKFVVLDSLNQRARLIQIRSVATKTLPMTLTRSLAPTRSKTKTPPDTTTTTTTTATTTTTTAATTTTTVATTTTIPTTTPTPTFVPAVNTSFIEFRFPLSALPYTNVTQMTNVMVRMEADILKALGASAASTDGIYIIPEYVVLNETQEVRFRVQVPNSEASTATVQAIALTTWPITTAYLQAIQSGLQVLCTSCSGSNCNVTVRPRCASENNNGLVLTTVAETFPCEETWCILAVFLSCLGAGIVIAGAAYYASTSSSYQRYHNKAQAIKEVGV